MNIYFLRHASAGESLEDPKKDEARALDSVGIEQCADVGRALEAGDVTVDAIISSPLKRAVQTASLVGRGMGFSGKLTNATELRPEALFKNFRRLLEKHSDRKAIMVVGHNPNLSDFLGRCVGVPEGVVAFDLAKGAVAKVVMEDARGTLAWCFTPKLLRKWFSVAAQPVAKKRKK